MKKYISIILAVLLTVFITVPAFADTQMEYLTDTAGLLDNEEAQNVEEALEQASDTYDITVAVAMVYGLDGKSAESYADDYYDETYGGDTDGVLFLVDMDSRSWHISTSGSQIDAIGDGGVSYMEDAIVPYLSDGEYETAFIEFADEVSYLNSGETSGDYYEESIPWGMNIGVAVIVGLIFGLIVAKRRKSQLKSVHRKTAAAEYEKSGSLNITYSNEFFLYSTLAMTVRVKEEDNDTHMSSGGFEHGGGGGHF